MARQLGPSLPEHELKDALATASYFGLPIYTSTMVPRDKLLTLDHYGVTRIYANPFVLNDPKLFPDRWFAKFARELTRRTQKRLKYCSHTRVDLQRDWCLGCEHGREEIADGLD